MMGLFGGLFYLFQMAPELTLLGLVALAGLTVWYLIWKKKNDFSRLLTTEVSSLTPNQFEHYVANLIQALPGWKASATRASGDQGCDVVAVSPDGARYAIQVKHYSNNVGNKAVQEIVAAKPMYNAQAAIVVTSGPGYTRQAIELANANGVVLWTLTDLAQIRRAVEQGKPMTALVGFTP